MANIKIVDNVMGFLRNNVVAMDRALNRMAVDVERLSKAQVPHKDGQLKASGRHERVGILKYRVVYDKEYARYQEFGGDPPRRVVRKYSKPGKKAFYLRDAGDTIGKRVVEYFKQEASKVTA